MKCFPEKIGRKVHGLLFYAFKIKKRGHPIWNGPFKYYYRACLQLLDLEVPEPDRMAMVLES